MSDENTFWLAIWRTIAAALVALTVSCSACDVIKTRTYVGAAYCQRTLQGADLPTWTKCE